jgi:UDP-N-acetylmuramoylalanine--D-glutamate ligase
VITARAFAGKHYAVYGLARSGLATVDALLASGAKLTAWDANADARSKVPEGAELADLDTADLGQFDSLIVTPGLPLNRHPIAQRARDAGVEIIGDIELFARARPELPPHEVVGITGTNGKSTTTALVHHILQTAGVPSTMGGNIGLPILAQDPLPEGGVYVLELSSYQLDLTHSLDCDVAALLNITPDHLDRYDGEFERYVSSKRRLFDMQSSSSAGIFNYNDEQTWQLLDALDLEEWKYAGLVVRVQSHGDEPWNTLPPSLRGPHNADNARVALAVASYLGVDGEKAARKLTSFKGLPHRMERVGKRGGVTFVNDSKATNPTATAPALAAFPAIRWICGGQAKSDNLDECAPHFGHVRSAYTIGEAAALFELLLKPHMPVKNCGKLDVAVREAAADAVAGDTVLLSPAGASFDQFKDFEERGNRFRELVGAL